MVRIALLGTTDLRDAAGEPIQALRRQPRRFALLAYLALEGRSGPVRRDRVLGVFWPEVPQAVGRRALSQALHYLRRSIGTDAVLTRGQDALQLDPDRVACDACDFLAALDAGQPEAALRHYRGDLLPGFYGGVPDFDDWLDRTRDALRRLAAEAAWAAAETAARAGATVAAGAHARRAAELTGGDEPAVRRLMKLLAELGDRAGALQAYASLAERLRAEYEAEPAPETGALAAQIRHGTADQAPRAGSVVVPAVAVESQPGDVLATPLVASVAPGIAPEPAPVRLRQRVRSAALTLVLGMAFVSLWGLRRGDAAEPLPARADARLLVEDVRGPGELAEPLTSEIVRRLADSEGIQVLLGQPGEGAPAGGPLLLLRTDVSADPDSLRATVILTDRLTGTAVASGRLAEPTASDRAAERLGAAIVGFARRATGAALVHREAELAKVPAAVRTAWQRARSDLADADSLHDAGLAEAARIRLAAADSLLERAQREHGYWVQVPIDRGEVELLRMWVLLTEPGGGWSPARQALTNGIAHADHALVIAPGNPRALELRGVLRTLLWISTPGDSVLHADPLIEAAYRDLKLATEQSGTAPRAWQYLSIIQFARGEYAHAYHSADRALDADAFLDDAAGVRMQHFWSALEAGNDEAARRGCLHQNADDPASWQASYCRLVLLAWGDTSGTDFPTALQLVSNARRHPYAEQNGGAIAAVHAILLAQHGDSEGAREMLAEVMRRSESRPELLHHAAWVHVTLGEPERARELLQRYVAGWPAARSGIMRSRRFTGLN